MNKCLYCLTEEEDEERYDYIWKALFEKKFNITRKDKVELDDCEITIKRKEFVDFLLSISYNKLSLIFYDNDDDECKVFKREINYCPMCGRKLIKRGE